MQKLNTSRNDEERSSQRVDNNVYVVSLNLKQDGKSGRCKENETYLIHDKDHDVYSLGYSADPASLSPQVHRPIFDPRYEEQNSSLLKSEYKTTGVGNINTES